MHKRDILDRHEPAVDAVLTRRLTKSGYRVLPKVRLGDVIGIGRTDSLDAATESHLSSAHFDFLVVHGTTPMFAVQFDDDIHAFGWRASTDILKNRLCKDADLPLLRISYTEIRENEEGHDHSTLLDYMLMRHVLWQEECAVIRNEIDEGDAAVSDGLPDHEYFAASHPFPGTRHVRERLWNEFRIASDVADPGKADADYRCDVRLVASGQLHHDELHTCRARVRVWHAAESARVPLMTQEVEVSLRSWLPLAPDIPDPQAFGGLFGVGLSPDVTPEAADELFERRVKGMWFPNLPGISADDVASHFVDYLGFRACEVWAIAHLRR